MIRAALLTAVILSGTLMVFMALMWSVNESVRTNPDSSEQDRQVAQQWDARFTALTATAAGLTLTFFALLRGT